MVTRCGEQIAPPFHDERKPLCAEGAAEKNYMDGYFDSRCGGDFSLQSGIIYADFMKLCWNNS